MCTTCGCGEGDIRVTSAGMTDAVQTPPGHSHPHEHDGDHHHTHRHDTHQHDDDGLRTHTIELEHRILAKNDALADANRRWLADRRLTALNLMSSPGAGKTSLLERTIAEADRSVTVIEGDQETVYDAERIRSAGARAVQVNTGTACHLDATMVQRALDELQPEDEGIVFIENVGNLVCPALFDLGEHRKVVVISVTEGDDKPHKYPHMFAAADLVVVNKIDLLPYVDFDVSRLGDDARALAPDVTIMPLSVRTGEGFERWQAWLDDCRETSNAHHP